MIESDGAKRLPVADDDLDDCEIADPANRRELTRLAPQGRSDGGAGVEEVDVTAAFDAVARRHFLLDMAVLARPARAPLFHFEDALGTARAKQRRQRFVAEAAPRPQGIFQMKRDGITFLLTESDRNGHLCHDRCATPADLTFVEEQNRSAFAGCGDRRVHAGAAAADHEHICGELGHGRFAPRG